MLLVEGCLTFPAPDKFDSFTCQLHQGMAYSSKHGDEGAVVGAESKKKDAGLLQVPWNRPLFHGRYLVKVCCDPFLQHDVSQEHNLLLEDLAFAWFDLHHVFAPSVRTTCSHQVFAPRVLPQSIVASTAPLTSMPCPSAHVTLIRAKCSSQKSGMCSHSTTESRVVDALVSTSQSTRRPPHFPCNRNSEVSGSLMVSSCTILPTQASGTYLVASSASFLDVLSPSHPSCSPSYPSALSLTPQSQHAATGFLGSYPV